MDNNTVKNQIQTKYDKEYREYDSIFKNFAGHHFIERKMKYLKKFRYINPNDVILEVGSATGIFSFEYEKLGINLTSIDLSENNIKYANKKKEKLNSKINFYVGDVENLDFKGDYFDGVISFSTLRYVPNLKKALSEIYRVLKPNGYAIIDFPNKNCPWFGGLKKKVIGREHIYDNHYKKERIVEFMKEAGFKNIKVKQGLFIPKSTPNYLYPIFKIIEPIAENLPILKNYSAIIFCSGEKI